MDQRKLKGSQAELQAQFYLESLGYRFLTKNYRHGPGEIDLIFLDGKELVFVEVKFRGSNLYNTALEAVNYLKINKIIRTAEVFMSSNPHLPQSGRIDVISIDETKSTPLEHLKNVSI
jgi:putative endonuclease